MNENLNGMNAAVAQALNELAELRQFPGAPREFWPRLLGAMARLAAADSMVLLLGNPAKAPRWSKISEWTSSPNPSRMRTAFNTELESIAERCLKEGSFVEQNDETSGCFTIAIRLKLARAEDEVILAGQLLDFTDVAAREALLRLSLAADTPALYQQNLAGRQAKQDVEKFAAVLDLLVPVNEATQFFSAALAFCNGVATRFRCDRSSLGWLEGGYIRLRAMSRTEQFDRQMAAAQTLEAAMEECLDQDEEILWPVPPEANVVAKEHGIFANEQKVSHLCSVPLRLDGKVIAVLTCERQEAPFSSVELQQLRLICDQAVRRISDLKHQDRWFGARWAAATRNYFSTWLGPEHTWSKVAAISGVLVLAALFLVRVNYRVEGNFILRSDAAEYLTAPFDGYIQEVFVRPGDHVAKGGKLLALNRSELLLEESAALADLTRYQRESEKARAARSLAEMRIADALAQQAQARLDLVRFRLENAEIKAAFDGVVVEGDLRERIAAPVKQGDALYKVARLDSLYAEAEVPERDVKEILGKARGEIAFVARPRLKYPVTIETIEPAAMTKKDGNVFLIRLKLDRAENWWRPGMTGLCKLSVEKRSLFWILTHRTVDFLRMKLWW
ncbi:MAG TPA: efflux RND transporter periplasmic adaptor subunit [Verrucomicrobiae bacterium]|nr:efflux RND transporter periplasmic adaptor subunit [Verrucomicrobiae bacterium]